MVAWEQCGAWSRDEALRLAAAAERGSSHPIAAAIVGAAAAAGGGDKPASVDNTRMVAGQVHFWTAARTVDATCTSICRCRQLEECMHEIDHLVCNTLMVIGR